MGAPKTEIPEVEIRYVNANDEALAKRVLRKIDSRVLIIMIVTYGLNFMDKFILSTAAVFGLTTDAHLKNDQFSWVGSMFFFGYLVFEYPAAVLVQMLPIGKYLTVATFACGAIMASMAACTNYGGLLTVRFLLGMAVCPDYLAYSVRRID
jgi:MFS family permease